MSARWTEEEMQNYLQRRKAATIPRGETRAWDAREAAEAGEPESKFMARVIALAKANSWEHYHTFNSERSEPGFPDLVLCNGQEVLFIECKTNRGQVTMAQQRWLSLLGHAGQQCHVYRPRDWPEIIERLERKASLP